MADVRLRDLNPAEFNYGVNVAGSLGVGTTSPNAKVEIRSDGSDSAGAEIRLQHANNNSTDIVSTVNFANNAGSVAMIQGGTTSGNTNGYISFHTDAGGTSVERMRILSNGHVGMGTGATVSTRLHVRGNSDTSDEDCAIRIVDADGTAGSMIPNLQFWTDSQQIYQIRANDSMGLQFRKADDATVVTFDEAGRVGIGETNPSNELHVSGTGTVLQLQSSSSAVYLQLRNSGGNLNFLGSTGTNLIFLTNNAEKMRITNDGKVGIATTNPTDTLTVGDGTSSIGITINKSVSGTGTLEFENAGTDKCYIRCNTTEDLIFGTGDSDRVSILENGNVGIGETNPTETLVVNGNLKVTGSVDVGSSGFSVTSGFIIAFAGTTPSGWLECNGQAVSRSTYSDLFAIVGVTYGSGNGSSTFNVPDLQGRVIMGEGGNTAGRTPADLESVADAGGSQTHTLTKGEIPGHVHSLLINNAPATTTTSCNQDDGACWTSRPRFNGIKGVTDASGGSNGGQGSRGDLLEKNTPADGAHNNIQPSLVVRYLIKT